MEECTLVHIPKRLNTCERQAIQIFEVGEKLFRRCTAEQLENPFINISLYDLSHNREGLTGEKISEEADVLYSVDPDSENHILDKKICALEIKTLKDNTIYFKELVDETTGNIAKISLLHAPIPCMYPHTVFQIYANEIEVTRGNYGGTMGSKPFKELRNRIRQELGIMIVRKEVNQNSIS